MYFFMSGGWIYFLWCQPTQWKSIKRHWISNFAQFFNTTHKLSGCDFFSPDTPLGCIRGEAIECTYVSVWFFIVYILDLVPETVPVALKIDVEGFECKVNCSSSKAALKFKISICTLTVAEWCLGWVFMRRGLCNLHCAKSPGSDC